MRTTYWTTLDGLLFELAVFYFNRDVHRISKLLDNEPVERIQDLLAFKDTKLDKVTLAATDTVVAGSTYRVRDTTFLEIKQNMHQYLSHLEEFQNEMYQNQLNEAEYAAGRELAGRVYVDYYNPSPLMEVPYTSTRSIMTDQLPCSPNIGPGFPSIYLNKPNISSPSTTGDDHGTMPPPELARYAQPYAGKEFNLRSSKYQWDHTQHSAVGSSSSTEQPALESMMSTPDMAVQAINTIQPPSIEQTASVTGTQSPSVSYASSNNYCPATDPSTADSSIEVDAVPAKPTKLDKCDHCDEKALTTQAKRDYHWKFKCSGNPQREENLAKKKAAAGRSKRKSMVDEIQDSPNSPPPEVDSDENTPRPRTRGGASAKKKRRVSQKVELHAIETPPVQEWTPVDDTWTRVTALFAIPKILTPSIDEFINSRVSSAPIPKIQFLLTHANSDAEKAHVLVLMHYLASTILSSVEDGMDGIWQLFTNRIMYAPELEWIAAMEQFKQKFD